MVHEASWPAWRLWLHTIDAAIHGRNSHLHTRRNDTKERVDIFLISKCKIACAGASTGPIIMAAGDSYTPVSLVDKDPYRSKCEVEEGRGL